MIILKDDDYLNVSNLYNGILENMTEKDLEGVFKELLIQANELKMAFKLTSVIHDDFEERLVNFINLKQKEKERVVYLDILNTDFTFKRFMNSIYLRKNIYFNIKENTFTTTGVTNETILVSNLDIDVNENTSNTGIPMYLMKYISGIFTEQEFRTMFFKSIVRRFKNNLKKNVDFNKSQSFQSVVNQEIVINMLNDDELLRDINLNFGQHYNRDTPLNYIDDDKFESLLPTILYELKTDPSTLGRYESIKYSNEKILDRIADVYISEKTSFSYYDVMPALLVNENFIKNSSKFISMLNDKDFELLVIWCNDNIKSSKQNYSYDGVPIEFSFGSCSIRPDISFLKLVSVDQRFNKFSFNYFKDSHITECINGVPYVIELNNNKSSSLDLMLDIKKLYELCESGYSIPKISLINIEKTTIINLINTFNNLDVTDTRFKIDFNLELFNKHILPLL